MLQNSLGLIEVIGLVAAIEAADAAVKAANIELIGYELAKGGGQVLVKLGGDVGAIKAGVQAGSAAARKVSRVVATHVIPRPNPQLACILDSEETVGAKTMGLPADSRIETKVEAEAETETEVETEAEAESEEKVEAENEAVTEAAEEEPEEDETLKAEGCNLCNDPACPRKKGDPKITCIHYGKNR